MCVCVSVCVCACVRQWQRRRQMDASVAAFVPKLDDDATLRLFVLMVQF